MYKKILILAVLLLGAASIAKASSTPYPAASWCKETSSNTCTTGTVSPTSCGSGYTSPSGSSSSSACTFTGCYSTTVSGFSVPQLSNGASTSVTKPVCYRSGGGYYSATATCNSGTVTISNQSGLICYSGYTHVAGSWYETNRGCYDVCVDAVCEAGTYNGYSYPNTNHYSNTSTLTKSITGGSCSAVLNCNDGTISTVSESCTCNPGYYLSGTSCVLCPAGSYCTGGTAAAVTCPSHMVSSSGASSCSCYSYYNSSTFLQTKYFDCNGTLSDGCEKSKIYDPILSCTQSQACGYCGDGVCTGSGCYIETASSCRADCGYCGDGYCAGTESSSNCYTDCGGTQCVDDTTCYYYCVYNFGYSNGYCSGGSGYCNGGYNCSYYYTSQDCNYYSSYYGCSWYAYTPGNCYCY